MKKIGVEVGMKKQVKVRRTELSQHDRKILEKYTGFYTNFIESNTAKSDIDHDQVIETRK